VAVIPGVERAALAVAAPFVLTLQTPPRIPLPYALPPGDDTPYLNGIDADYLRTMGIRVVRGRGIDREDVDAHRDVALVNERMAARVWPGSDAVGKCMRFGSDTMPCITVVGVVSDVQQSELLEEPTLQYYVPIGPRFDNQLGRVLLLRTEQRPDALVAAVRKEILQLAPRLPYIDIRPYDAILEPELRSWHLGAVLFSLFAALAAVVAAVGLYSVVSYATAQRRAELALRVALGARPFAVTRVVVRGSVLPCFAGVGIGLGLAVLASRRIQPLLFQTSATDPRVFVAVTALLIGVGVLSIAAPAIRAIRADPVLALREP
jgi:hypothetical protein